MTLGRFQYSRTQSEERNILCLCLIPACLKQQIATNASSMELQITVFKFTLCGEEPQFGAIPGARSSEAKHTRRSSNFSICRLQITMLQFHCSYELKRRIYSAGTCKDLFTSSELKQSIKTNICEVIKSHKRIDDEQNKWNASNIKPLSIFMTSEPPAMSDI